MEKSQQLWLFKAGYGKQISTQEYLAILPKNKVIFIDFQEEFDTLVQQGFSDNVCQRLLKESLF